MDINDFSFSIFNPQTESNRTVVNKCFELWWRVWRDTIKQLDGVETLFSDDFDRQDEVHVLWHRDNPVAMMFYRYRDFRLDHIQNDSYFRCWDKNAVAELARGGNRLAIGGQGTVHPEYRKQSQTKIPVKELIVYNSLIEVISNNKNLEVICGTVRNDKGMNKLIYNCGFSKVRENVIFHNVPVDLVAFYPQRDKLSISPEFMSFIEQIEINTQRSKYGHSRAA